MGQLNRPSFPAIAGPGALRGPVVPLGRLGRHGRAGRAGVSRSSGPGASAAQFVPHLAGEVGHLDVYPAHPALAAADRELRRSVPARIPRPAAAAAELWALGPAVAVLAAARGAARGRPGRPRVGRAHGGGERGERLRAFHAARRPAGPGGRRRALREDGPALPALRQAGAARRRPLGGGAEPSRRRPRDDADRRDHSGRRAHGRRRGAPGRRPDLRDGLQRVGLRRTHAGLRRRRRRAATRNGAATPRPTSA